MGWGYSGNTASSTCQPPLFPQDPRGAHKGLAVETACLVDGWRTLGAARAWAVPSASQANQCVDDD